MISLSPVASCSILTSNTALSVDSGALEYVNVKSSCRSDWLAVTTSKNLPSDRSSVAVPPLTSTVFTV